LTAFTSGHPAAAAVIAASALAAAFMLWRAARRGAAGARKALRGHQAEDALTMAAAGLAQAVVMTGMWRFFGNVLHFSGAERISMFAFLEISVMAAAFRARRNMRQFGAAGAEGVAVWALSGLSAVFSALDARSGAEAVFRLSAPLVAAWLWHRGLGLERRRSSGRVVHWRLTAERVLVWLGLAEPSARAAGDVDAHRRIARLAKAVKRLRDLRAAGARTWRQDRARRRLDKAMEAAVEHAALASDPARQDQMRDQIAALNAAGGLASLDLAAPWDRRDADVAGRLRELEQSLADERARADAALGELESARLRIEELSRADQSAREPAPEPARESAQEPDRDTLVDELAEEIRAAARAGDRWRADYDDLIRRTGRQRRYCEYLVQDARSAVFGSAPDPAPQSAPGPARLPARAEALASANGHAPAP